MAEVLLDIAQNASRSKDVATLRGCIDVSRMEPHGAPSRPKGDEEFDCLAVEDNVEEVQKFSMDAEVDKMSERNAMSNLAT